MKIKLDNSLCVCGHAEGLHVKGCLWESKEFIRPFSWCYCKKFRQDNLRYIEMKYDKITSRT